MFFHSSRSSLACLAIGMGMMTAPLATVDSRAAEGPDGPSRQAIEAIVHEYILSHPEVVGHALQTLEARRREAEQQRAREALLLHRDQLLQDQHSPVGGNPRGDVTVVEFFDYRCGDCKGVAGTVKTLVQSDPTIRLVYKELPVLGPDSVLAARAALAAQAQGKYVAFHDALMAAPAPLTSAAIFQIAAEVGLDVGRLQSDMEAPGIRAAIDRNHALAGDLGINGTPAFVVGLELVPGAIDLHAMKALVSQARVKQEVERK